MLDDPGHPRPRRGTGAGRRPADDVATSEALPEWFGETSGLRCLAVPSRRAIGGPVTGTRTQAGRLTVAHPSLCIRDLASSVA